jgi:zinc/manganese transport system permease protein
MVEILWLPFAACLVLTAIHVYLGLHVLARGVIFVDLALAQVAALGLTVAILAGHEPASEGAYWYALAFAIAGAALFAWTRTREERVPQEAVIGIVYAVSAALAVIVVDRAPQGAEHIKQLLVGSLLSVTGEDVVVIAVLYALVGALHWKVRATMLAISMGSARLPQRALLAWDLLFFATFAIVVTSSVRIAGVLLVFSYLVVPAAVAALLASTVRARLAIGWLVGGVASAAGLGASWAWDLPTGAAIVATFGAAIAIVGAALWGQRLVRAVKARGRAELLPLVIAFGIALSVGGALLVAFPRMDHPWLDLVERLAPPVQTAFLTPPELDVRADAVESIGRAEQELARLRKLQEDVRWGVAAMSEEKQERMRQYIAGRSEILAGDQLSLRGLRSTARERQRFALGIPLVLAGVGVVWLGRRAWRTAQARIISA